MSNFDRLPQYVEDKMDVSQDFTGSSRILALKNGIDRILVLSSDLGIL